MKRVVLIGLDPATVDFSDPTPPPGMTAERIHAGVKLALGDFAARGWQAQNCFINTNETAVPTVAQRLAGHVYDCVVVGAGLRLPPRHRNRNVQDGTNGVGCPRFMVLQLRARMAASTHAGRLPGAALR